MESYRVGGQTKRSTVRQTWRIRTGWRMSSEDKQQQRKIIIYPMGKEEKGLVFLPMCILGAQGMMSRHKLQEPIGVICVGDGATRQKRANTSPLGHLPHSCIYCVTPCAVSNCRFLSAG